MTKFVAVKRGAMREMQYNHRNSLAVGVQKVQPCDASRMLYRKCQDACLDARLGYVADLADGHDLSFATRNASGVSVRSVTIRVSIECNTWPGSKRQSACSDGHGSAEDWLMPPKWRSLIAQ